MDITPPKGVWVAICAAIALTLLLTAAALLQGRTPSDSADDPTKTPHPGSAEALTVSTY